jgi:3-methyladenine DNA glycosylase AlkD
MNPNPDLSDPRRAAAEIDRQIRALTLRNTPNVRSIRRAFSRRIGQESGDYVLELAKTLFHEYGYRSVPFELIEAHREAFLSLNEEILQELGQGINSWWSVDSFARTLVGPAWREGLISDELILRWARSPDRWWRRAVLVSTVALNVRSKGGKGDVPRTLRICRLLVGDHDDMVAKAMSWALRELVPHDPATVRAFIIEYEERLAARVKREVGNKLETGLKSPGSMKLESGSKKA